MQGTIVFILKGPDCAFEVEFSNDQGETIDTFPLKPDQVKIIWECETH